MLTHLRRSSGRAGRFNVGRSDCATRRAQVLRSVTLATVLAAVVVAVTPAPVAAEPGSYIKSNVKSVPVLGNPPTVDIPLRYRCAPSEPFARIWVSVAQWQYNGVGTAIPDPTNTAPVALYTSTTTPFTQETPYIPICDGKQHKVSLTIPRIVQTSPFIAGEALVTIIQGLQLTTNRLEIVVDVR
jgi:hypothetical protein